MEVAEGRTDLKGGIPEGLQSLLDGAPIVIMLAGADGRLPHSNGVARTLLANLCAEPDDALPEPIGGTALTTGRTAGRESTVADRTIMFTTGEADEYGIPVHGTDVTRTVQVESEVVHGGPDHWRHSCLQEDPFRTDAFVQRSLVIGARFFGNLCSTS